MKFICLKFIFIHHFIQFIASEPCELNGAGQCDISSKISATETTTYRSSTCMRVAALDLVRKYGDSCRLTANLNLETLERAARISSQKGAQMLVSPEDGIIYEPRGDIKNCFEEVPDPKTLDINTTNPCVNAELYKSMPILTRLSCIAKSNGIYLIANYGTRQTCSPGEKVDHELCPSRGFFQLNTDVVLDPTGKFIGRYRKYHPFGQEIFDKSPLLEHTYFDTPFGRFGLFTCFDILFRQPAVDLVEQYNVDTIIFPTWWFDELPMLSAIQFQDGWSLRHQVNLIASNINRPELGSIGSAIFTSNHTLNTGATNKRTKLLIANIDKAGTNDCGSGSFKGFNAQLIDLGDEPSRKSYAHKNLAVLGSDTFFKLNKKEDKVTKCVKDVCCSIEYESEALVSSSNNSLVLIVRDSPRAGFQGWYEQFCVLATLNDISSNQSPNSSDSLIFNHCPSFTFLRLNMKMNSTTRYVYPFGAHDVSSLVSRSERYFNHDSDKLSSLVTCEHSLLTVNKRVPIYSFGLYGRHYERDEPPNLMIDETEPSVFEPEL